MKNRLLLSLIFCCLSLSLLAQGGNRYASAKIFAFKKTSTIIVLDDLVNGRETPYNTAIQLCVEQYWKITPFAFKRYSEMNDFIPAEGFSMLLKSRRDVMNADGFSSQLHNDIALLMCHKDSLTHYGGTDELAFIQMKDANQAEEVIVKLPVLLQAMQHYLTFIGQGRGMDIYNFEPVIRRFYNENNKFIHNKKLYVCKEDLPADFSPEQFKENYHHKVEIIDRRTLSILLERKPQDALLFHCDGGLHDIWVFDMKDGSILYYFPLIERGKLQKKDIQRLNKKA